MGACTSKSSATEVPPAPPAGESKPAASQKVPVKGPEADSSASAPASSAAASGAATTVPVSTKAAAAAPEATTAPAPATTTATATEQPPASPSPRKEEADGDEAPNSPMTPNDATNLETYSEKVEDWPLMRYGQLTKQSGSGIVKNWRRRNFTVERGVLKYYELFLPEYPYGEREKGCFSLQGYTVVENPNAREPLQILLQSAVSAQNKQFDLLVQADDLKKKSTWLTIFGDHIAYANKYDVKAPERLGGDHKTSSRF